MPAQSLDEAHKSCILAHPDRVGVPAAQRDGYRNGGDRKGRKDTEETGQLHVAVVFDGNKGGDG